MIAAATKAYAGAIIDMTRLANSGSRSALCGLRSERPRSRANGQHRGRAPLRENFSDWTLRYVCNAAADPSSALEERREKVVGLRSLIADPKSSAEL